MAIYGALIIPVIACFVLLYFFRKKIVWWEVLLQIVAALILIASMKAIVEVTQVKSKEYWGSFVKYVEYYEDWDEWIDQTCSSTCCCDSKGNNCQTTYYDCSYRRYHSAYWVLFTTTDEKISISEKEYNRIKVVLGNETFTELNRDYYHDDGDKYVSVWDASTAKAIPVTTIHHYENRVKKADQSIFHFKEVTKEDIELYSLKYYPQVYDGYKMSALLGDSTPDAMNANKKVQYINGLLGSKKEVRCFILVFKDKPIQAGLYQEWLWSGGNMNEFIVCIGLNKSRQVQWSNVISWSTNESVKVNVKKFVESQDTVNLMNVANFMEQEVDKNFVRRNFEEFDYLTVDPPTWAIVLTYILVIALSFGIGKWSISNEYENE